MRSFVCGILLLFIFALVSCDTDYGLNNIDIPEIGYVVGCEGLYSETIFIQGVELRTVSLTRSGGLSSFNLEYPELNDFSNDRIVEINRLIYDMIVTHGNINGIYYEIYAFKDIWIDINISYRVTYAGDSLLSVHFFGNISGGGVGARGYMGIHKAITIDLDNGTVISLGDIFTYEELYGIIDGYFLSEGNLIFSANSHYNRDEQVESELLYSAKEHFLELLSNGELLNDIRYFYIKENGIGLIVTNEIFRDPFIVELVVDRYKEV